MPKRPEESDEQIMNRIAVACGSYLNHFELLPLGGGKIIFPDDLFFLLKKIEQLEKRNARIEEELRGFYGNQHDQRKAP